MESVIVEKGFVVLALPRCAVISRSIAETLVRRALKSRGISGWHGIHIDLLDGRDGALLFASPLPEYSLSIADYALPLLEDYFSE